MKHLCAFYKSVDSATLTPLDAIVDDVLTRPAADRLQVPPDLNAIAWAAAIGVNLTRAQIVSPSLAVRRMTMDIIPHERGVILFTLESGRVFVPKAELVLTPTENFMVYGSEDGAGATVMAALVCLKIPGAAESMPAGDIRVVRATAGVTLVPFVWTTLTPTLEYDLEPGVYQLVGFIPMSAGCIAARAIFTGQGYRPGVIGVSTTAPLGFDHGNGFYDKLMWEPLGQFSHISPPQFQFFSGSADTAETIELYLVKIA